MKRGVDALKTLIVDPHFYEMDHAKTKFYLEDAEVEEVCRGKVAPSMDMYGVPCLYAHKDKEGAFRVGFVVGLIDSHVEIKSALAKEECFVREMDQVWLLRMPHVPTQAPLEDPCLVTFLACVPPSMGRDLATQVYESLDPRVKELVLFPHWSSSMLSTAFSIVCEDTGVVETWVHYVLDQLKLVPGHGKIKRGLTSKFRGDDHDALKMKAASTYFHFMMMMIDAKDDKLSENECRVAFNRAKLDMSHVYTEPLEYEGRWSTLVSTASRNLGYFFGEDFPTTTLGSKKGVARAMNVCAKYLERTFSTLLHMSWDALDSDDEGDDSDGGECE